MAIKKLLILLIILVGFSACAQKKNNFSSPQHYDLNHPEKFEMPSSLVEISGIAFNRGNADTIFAEQDEEGKVYFFKPGEKPNHLVFGKHGDYEDIAVYDSNIYLLRSDGVFFNFPLKQIQSVSIDSVNEQKDLLPKGEYEGMYADAQANKLYVLCKNCNVDKASKKITGYILEADAKGGLSLNGTFIINLNAINLKGNLRPSAIAKNPLTGEWYVLSSVQKMLVVADANGIAKTSYPIDPKLFTQPEGIAFDNQNNLYISNEGAESGIGTILKFAYKP